MYEKLFRGERVDPDSLILKLQVFGQEVFRRKDGTRGAPGQIAVPASYPVGPAMRWSCSCGVGSTKSNACL